MKLDPVDALMITAIAVAFLFSVAMLTWLFLREVP